MSSVVVSRGFAKVGKGQGDGLFCVTIGLALVWPTKGHMN
jgi:hypothetical protein